MAAEPSSIARTAATGSALLPDVLRFSTSLPFDRRLFAQDIAGSVTHAVMLGRRGIVPRGDVDALRRGLFAILDDFVAGRLSLADEEDVHMAVEADLAKRLGDVAGRLHTARSRNDQVALDLRLYAREQSAERIEDLADLVDLLCDRAAGSEGGNVLPGYTHRQRAQPIVAGYLYCAWASMLARDLTWFQASLESADLMPLGVGALSGTSLPTDREVVRALLGFSKSTVNGLDTVGDRDFAIDFAYAAARCLVHVSRIAQDLVDFTTEEFGLFELDGSIAGGSSMMPQKKNPDLFELVRAHAGRAIGDLTALLAVVKGLPSGYMRDLQETQPPFFAATDRSRECLAMLKVGLPAVRLRPERGLQALSSGFLQATDLAERAVARGMAFRDAYRAVGSLVRARLDAGASLAGVDPAQIRKYLPGLTDEDLAILDPKIAADAKESMGGTGRAAVANQVMTLRGEAARARQRAATVPRLTDLITRLRAVEI
jgi:argininosuccinate lyase